MSLMSEPAIGGLLLQLVDVTGRARLEDQLLQLATTDGLTGLVNRRGFESALREALDDLEAGRVREVAVCFLDLDSFKPSTTATAMRRATRCWCSWRPGSTMPSAARTSCRAPAVTSS